MVECSTGPFALKGFWIISSNLLGSSWMTLEKNSSVTCSLSKMIFGQEARSNEYPRQMFSSWFPLFIYKLPSFWSTQKVLLLLYFTLIPLRDQFRYVENLAADCASICTRKFEIPRVHLESETSWKVSNFSINLAKLNVSPNWLETSF